jgi:hypothetical protein
MKHLLKGDLEAVKFLSCLFHDGISGTMDLSDHSSQASSAGFSLSSSSSQPTKKSKKKGGWLLSRRV